MAGTAGYGMWGSSRFVRSTSGQKSKELKEESDSDDDELFDGEKLKTRLMSMWNNMRHGQFKVVIARFSYQFKSCYFVK